MTIRSLKMMRDFFRLESASGLLLIGAALLALIVRNSPLSPLYDSLFSPEVGGSAEGAFSLSHSLHLGINDGLMAVFFLVVGLELKREMMEGQLATRQQILLPAVAAVGGVVVPALLYAVINRGDPAALRGWAIPAATDIAFALGVLSLLGKRIPESLKVCLVAIAIIDDLAAILIIALFYSGSLAPLPLMGAAGGVGILFLLNRLKIMALSPYMITGFLLWGGVLLSGVHATLAGVVLALFIPLRRPGGRVSPLALLEKGLHPWVAYGILPLFAFANAGVSFAGFSRESLSDPVTLGVIVGLLIGKPVGVGLASAVVVLLRVCRLPEGVSALHYAGLCVLTGIGFTMSLFIGGLAFGLDDQQNAVRLGVLLGSALSAIGGGALLWTAAARGSCALPSTRR